MLLPSDDDGMGGLGDFVAKSPHPFKVAYDRGSVQVCQDFRQGFAGRGAERYDTGEIYVGEYMAGERYGRGTFRHANGQTLVSLWKDNRPVGRGCSGRLTTKGRQVAEWRACGRLLTRRGGRDFPGWACPCPTRGFDEHGLRTLRE